jgi:hypothetical protein
MFILELFWIILGPAILLGGIWEDLGLLMLFPIVLGSSEKKNKASRQPGRRAGKQVGRQAGQHADRQAGRPAGW